MSKVPESGRAVARAAASAFGGAPRVHRFYDESEDYAIDVMACEDRPSEGLSTYSTVGLHQVPNVLDGEDTRVEIAGTARTDLDNFPNVLATAALLVVKEGWLCAPGVVFPALLSDYGVSSTMEHLLWCPPFPWDQLSSVEISDELVVHWLLAVPISAGERTFLLERGFGALEELFSKHRIEYFDLHRASLVRSDEAH